jgi:hypothetical protein
MANSNKECPMKHNANGKDYLGPLLTEPGRIRREAVRKRKLFDEKSVSPEAIPDHEAQGCQVDRRLRRVTRVKREKEIDERLENRLWMLLFKLGYPEISEGEISRYSSSAGVQSRYGSRLTFSEEMTKQLSSPNAKLRRSWRVAVYRRMSRSSPI